MTSSNCVGENVIMFCGLGEFSCIFETGRGGGWEGLDDEDTAALATGMGAAETIGALGRLKGDMF